MSVASTRGTFIATGKRALATPLPDLFTADPDRVAACTIEAAELTFDLSKTHLTAALRAAGTTWAETVGMAGWLADVAGGAIVNGTEQRAALHSAWRAAAPIATTADGQPVASVIADANARMERLVEAWRASDATATVHIGIGGSVLGPEVALRALEPLHNRRFTVRMIANVDGEAAVQALDGLDPQRTRVVLVSKSWTTLETQMNAGLVVDWLKAGGVADPASRFAAVTEKTDLARAWGVPADAIFPVPAWVGGRYSLWSPVGLPIALQLGWAGFQALRAGAAAMDAHAVSAPLAANAPVLTALLGTLYTDVARWQSRAVFAYDERLALLPAHLSQVEMESLGKRVSRSGRPIRNAGAVLWGGIGTDAQHAVFQALHQAPKPVPVDLIAVATPRHDHAESHRQLLANALAQAAALMAGKSAGQVDSELAAAGLSKRARAAQGPHRVFPGNRPSSFIVIDALTPERMGALLAFYEWRTIAQARLWGLNPFDQWGVELGKVMARAISGGGLNELDASTQALAHRLKL
jgi:glucose-6-phosphate isomerase